MDARLVPDRLRGHALQRIRAAWFREHPLCVGCLRKSPPRYELAAVLDHIIPLDKGGADFDADGGDNRQGLCVPCHVEKTAQDMGYTHRPRIGLDGWPVEGERS